MEKFIPPEIKPYTAAGTDIVATWRKRYGYIPASEMPHIIEKHKFYRELAAKELNELLEC